MKTLNKFLAFAVVFLSLSLVVKSFTMAKQRERISALTQSLTRTTSSLERANSGLEDSIENMKLAAGIIRSLKQQRDEALDQCDLRCAEVACVGFVAGWNHMDPAKFVREVQEAYGTNTVGIVSNMTIQSWERPAMKL